MSVLIVRIQGSDGFLTRCSRSFHDVELPLQGAVVLLILELVVVQTSIKILITKCSPVIELAHLLLAHQLMTLNTLVIIFFTSGTPSQP